MTIFFCDIYSLYVFIFSLFLMTVLSVNIKLLIRDHLDLQAHLANQDQEVCKVIQASMASQGVLGCLALLVRLALKASPGIEARMACPAYPDHLLVELSLSNDYLLFKRDCQWHIYNALMSAMLLWWLWKYYYYY